MMRKKFLDEIIPGTAAYVIAHAMIQAKRGRKPSLPFGGIKNPRKALEAAEDIEKLKPTKSRNCDYLNNCYVQEYGRILPMGIIRILNCNVRDTPHVRGLALWSKKLAMYGNEQYFAQIIQTSHEVVVYQNSERGKYQRQEITRIPAEEIVPCSSIATARVETNGYLNITGEKFLGKFSRDILDERDFSALSLALEGRDPKRYSNSTFVRVSPKLAGEKVYEIQFGMLGERRVYDLNGKPIEHYAHYPLCFLKWTGSETSKVTPWSNIDFRYWFTHLSWRH